MIIGTCRLVFSLPGVRSLKDKRSIVRRLIERARTRFNASVAEVDSMDSLRMAVIAIAVVSNDSQHANAMLDKIVESICQGSEVPLVDRRLEMIHVDHQGANVSTF